MRASIPVSLSALLAQGCCGRGVPMWDELAPLRVEPGVTASLDLATVVIDDKPGLRFEADAEPGVIAEISDAVLSVTTQPDFEGDTIVSLTVEDRCGNRVIQDLLVTTEATTTTPGGGTPNGACPVTFTYAAVGAPDAVAVAGLFNDWSTDQDLLTFDGTAWTTTLSLPPGAYPYKLVEIDETAFDPVLGWTCDPNAPYIQCDADYKQPWEIGLVQDCVPNGRSCNSLAIVRPCDAPRVEATAIHIDPAAGSAHVEAAIRAGASPIASVRATVDGADAAATVTDTAVTVDVTGLAPGRHTVRVEVTDEALREAEPLYVPAWIDDRGWGDQVLYFAFVDRVRDGDSALAGPEGATAIGGDYEGGDLAGLVAMLPYLDDLGVTTLWVSNLQDGAEGAWDGDCGLTYAGYHAYWPDDPVGVEEHFGDEAMVHALVDGAHARGMRVIVDWVANHVHQDHPYYAEHPDWFGPYAFCKDTVDGQLNFDRIPETCWFAPYLPDIDYAQPDALDQMVRDALHWATTYGFDGFRVDAVKHMPHSVAWNLEHAVEAQIEHQGVGGTDVFYTVGETFDGAERIASYVGPDQLDAQFDFPLFYTMRDVLAYGNGEPYNLLAAWDASHAAYGDAPMSTFLGNHDVNRFVTDASAGWQDPCDGANIRVATPPAEGWPYERLMLGWTFLFTMPGVPLVYYGDELGLPGNPDPDNRQPLWDHATGLDGVATVDDLAGRVSTNAARVLRHVRALAHARRDHPALRTGGWTEWWREPDLIAYARTSAGGDDHALVVINRGGTQRTLVNGLAFAGLPEGRYVDVETGAEVVSTGDSVSVSVDPNGSRVLVWTP